MKNEPRYVRCFYIPYKGQVVRYENRDWTILALVSSATGGNGMMARISPVSTYLTGYSHEVLVSNLEVKFQ